jgi:hypothetical protein
MRLFDGMVTSLLICLQSILHVLDICSALLVVNPNFVMVKDFRLGVWFLALHDYGIDGKVMSCFEKTEMKIQSTM